MSVPIVSSRWLFSFTGRQSRYSLRAAAQVALGGGAGERAQERVHRNVIELDGLELAVGSGEQVGGAGEEPHPAQHRGGAVAGAAGDARRAAGSVEEGAHQNRSEERGGSQAEKAPPDVARGADGDEPREIIVAARVTVPEHAAHAVAEVEDPGTASSLLHRCDGGRDVVEEIAVDVPVPVEVLWMQAALELELLIRQAVAAQLGDVDVRPVREQLLDEVAAGECMTVLRPAWDEQHRLAEDRLIPGLLDRLVAGDPEHPAVPGGRIVNLL